jgi:hypothetical protein
MRRRVMREAIRTAAALLERGQPDAALAVLHAVLDPAAGADGPALQPGPAGAGADHVDDDPGDDLDGPLDLPDVLGEELRALDEMMRDLDEALKPAPADPPELPEPSVAPLSAAAAEGLIEAALRCTKRLRPRDAAFLIGLRARVAADQPPSRKQQARLLSIARRLKPRPRPAA